MQFLLVDSKSILFSINHALLLRLGKYVQKKKAFLC